MDFALLILMINGNLTVEVFVAQKIIISEKNYLLLDMFTADMTYEELQNVFDCYWKKGNSNAVFV